MDREQRRQAFLTRYAPFIDSLLETQVAPVVMVGIGKNSAGRVVHLLGLEGVNESEAIVLLESLVRILRAKHLKSN